MVKMKMVDTEVVALMMLITKTMLSTLATITTLSNLARKSASIESTSSSSKQIGASDPPNLMNYIK